MAELQEHFKMDYQKILARTDSIIRGNKFRHNCSFGNFGTS